MEKPQLDDLLWFYSLEELAEMAHKIESADGLPWRQRSPVYKYVIEHVALCRTEGASIFWHKVDELRREG